MLCHLLQIVYLQQRPSAGQIAPSSSLQEGRKPAPQHVGCSEHRIQLRLHHKPRRGAPVRGIAGELPLLVRAHYCPHLLPSACWRNQNDCRPCTADSRGRPASTCEASKTAQGLSASTDKSSQYTAEQHYRSRKTSQKKPRAPSTTMPARQRRSSGQSSPRCPYSGIRTAACGAVRKSPAAIEAEQ